MRRAKATLCVACLSLSLSMCLRTATATAVPMTGVYDDGQSNQAKCQRRCQTPWPGALKATFAIDPMTFDPGKPTVTQAIYPVLADCCDKNQSQQYCKDNDDVAETLYEIPDNLHPTVVCDSDEHTARVHYCANTSVDLAGKITKEFGHGDNYLIYSFSSSTTFIMHWHLEASHREYATYVSSTRNSYSATVRSPHDPTRSYMLSDVALRKIDGLRHVPLNKDTLQHEFRDFFQDMGIVLYRRATMGCRQSAIWMLEQDRLTASMRSKIITETESSFLWFMHTKHVTVRPGVSGAASWYLAAGINVSQCIGGAVCGDDWHTWEAECALEPDFVGGDHPVFVSDFVRDIDTDLGRKLQRAEYAYLLCGALRQWIQPVLDRDETRTNTSSLLATIKDLRTQTNQWRARACIDVSLPDMLAFGRRLYTLSQDILTQDN